MLVGIALSFAPIMPVVAIDPELVLLLLLPPLLYEAGVGMSWRGFRFNLRPILLLAIGCTLFTAAAVAAAGHWALGMPWAVAFVLGAVVSPPDPVAPMAIAKRLQLPTRLLTVLEGEGLVNDATALILTSFAVAAVVTGSSSLAQAAGGFGLILAGETVWGVGVAWVMLHFRSWIGNPQVEVIFALLTPFHRVLAAARARRVGRAGRGRRGAICQLEWPTPDLARDPAPERDPDPSAWEARDRGRPTRIAVTDVNERLALEDGYVPRNVRS